MSRVRIPCPAPEATLGGMTDDEPSVIELEDAESNRLHATWSRSRKHLIVTVMKRGCHAQVELTSEQVEALMNFLEGSSTPT